MNEKIIIYMAASFIAVLSIILYIYLSNLPRREPSRATTTRAHTIYPLVGDPPIEHLEINHVEVKSQGQTSSTMTKPFEMTHMHTSGPKSNGERTCMSILQKLFPNTPIMTNVRCDGLINPLTDHQLEFDFFIPSLNLAIEFNGSQHYTPNRIANLNDVTKSLLAAEKGVHLITIPYRCNTYEGMQEYIITLLEIEPKILQNSKLGKEALTFIQEQRNRTRNRHLLA